MNSKLVKIFATVNSTPSATYSWPSTLEKMYGGYANMDVVLDVRAIAGGNISVAFQEEFPVEAGTASNVGSTYVTTAKLNGAISATGVYTMTYWDNNAQTGTIYATPSTGKNPLLGKGQNKQVVVTSAGLTSIVMDVITIFYED